MIGRRNSDDPLARLFAEYAEGLLGFLVFRTGDRALAEDILGDAFERALTSRRRPRGQNEKAWLYTIALNRLRDLARRRGAEGRALERVGVPTSSGGLLETVDDRDLVQRALARLPEDEREAVALRYGAELSLREVADVTGEKQTTIEGRIYRALGRLREEID
jgi:RNA polymerase sigma-70 factor (ECF subfamily)